MSSLQEYQTCVRNYLVKLSFYDLAKILILKLSFSNLTCFLHHVACNDTNQPLFSEAMIAARSVGARAFAKFENFNGFVEFKNRSPI